MSAPHDGWAGGVQPLRTLFGVLSPQGARGRLTILILHRVLPERDEIFPNQFHAATFRERMRWIRSWFNVMPLEEAVGALEHGALPDRALSITFDDGYADNATVALPILRELGLHATFFVATRFLNGGWMWNDAVVESLRHAPGANIDLSELDLGVRSLASAEQRRETIRAALARLKYLPQPERQAGVDAIVTRTATTRRSDLMMTSEQVRELAGAGMGIGGHTVTHPILAKLDAKSATREIADGRDFLEGLLRQSVRLFAYPNGTPDTDYTGEHVRIVKDLGFSAAVSTAGGAARAGDSPYELPRFAPWGGTRLRWAMRIARNLGAPTKRAAA